MPLYEYECYVCHHRFEKIQRVDDKSPVTCPNCDGEVRRLLGVPALQFKGSGWYVTDYGKGNGGRSSALAKTESSEGGDGASKSDTKPQKESKAEKKANTS
jgi:putative FmdB family regulatory protein